MLFFNKHLIDVAHFIVDVSTSPWLAPLFAIEQQNIAVTLTSLRRHLTISRTKDTSVCQRKMRLSGWIQWIMFMQVLRGEWNIIRGSFLWYYIDQLIVIKNKLGLWGVKGGQVCVMYLRDWFLYSVYELVICCGQLPPIILCWWPERSIQQLLI